MFSNPFLHSLLCQAPVALTSTPLQSVIICLRNSTGGGNVGILGQTWQLMEKRVCSDS